jgi:Na+-translocating ferredoxin:NAD+ oxidoreductase subunit B
MHTVIARQCTGCELCIDACPVSCISMETSKLPAWNTVDAQLARDRYLSRNLRMAKLEAENIERLRRQKQQLALLNKAKTGF